jgi:hypothetical protein
VGIQDNIIRRGSEIALSSLFIYLSFTHQFFFERAKQGIAVWTKTFRVQQKYRIAQLLPIINNNLFSTSQGTPKKRCQKRDVTQAISYL